jgi:hypothetical protein
MAVLVVQLSDLHALATGNIIDNKWDALCRAVVSDLADVQTCIIVFCGDAAWAGKQNEFDVARLLIESLRRYVNSKFPQVSITTVSVPGNHDCDLTSEDQTARVTLRQKVTADRPSGSIERILLEPQKNYFQFAKDLSAGSNSTFSATSPFYNSLDVKSDTRLIRLHLVNSSWTSIIHETQDLRFPLAEFKPPTVPTADYAIAVIHHPYHWLLMPEVRRELRDQIEANSDLVLTGHEHENELSQRSVDQGPTLSYLEGGVLQESNRPFLCSFNTIRLDFESDARLVKKYFWSEDHFDVEGTPQSELLMLNSLRRDRKFRLTHEFEKRLDEPEDLINHPKTADIRLSQIFSFPDLRKHEDQGQEPIDDKKSSSPISVWIRSDRVFEEISKRKNCLILGGDKAGKTSLAKRLFSELHRAGKAPLFLEGEDISNSASIEGLKRTISKALKEQYQCMSMEQYTQLQSDVRVLVFDDLHNGPTDPNLRSRMLKYFASSFDQIILLSSNEFYLEVLSEQGATPVEFVPYMLYDICDFGQARLHDLAGRWLKLRNPDVTGEQLQIIVGNLCEKVELLLATASLPHTPWLLVVLIENAESPDTGNAKNGAYGKLYEAVITAALYRSQLRDPDIDGKYLYLARFAHYLYSLGKATVSDAEAREFHDGHCKDYDWTVSYDKMRDDLVTIRILRLDGDSISFRVKYLYCYFVAHWLQRNIHTDAAKKEIHELSERLHHDVSSNVLVMLASLTQDPVVLREMRSGSAKLFASNMPAVMVNEVEKLNDLDVPDNVLTLPHTAPEANRKMFREAYDEQHLTKANEDHDGRRIEAIPKDDSEENVDEATKTVTQAIRQIRAAIRTIEILGQVLRNGAASQTAEEKLAIMEEIVMLGRRLLGYFYDFLKDIDDMIAATQDIFYRVMTKLEESEKTAPIDPAATNDKVDVGRMEQARLFSNRFWFELFSMGSFGVLKRIGTAIGLRALDPTIQRLLAKDPALANRLVRIETMLKRRENRIPADEIVKFHKELRESGNKVARIVLEAMVFERLIMYETHYQDSQKICAELNIRKLPAKAFDPNLKKFTPGT